MPPPFAGTRRVTCRSVTVWPFRGPWLMPSSTVESASSYSWARPRSSVHVIAANAAAVFLAGLGTLRSGSSAAAA